MHFSGLPRLPGSRRRRPCSSVRSVSRRAPSFERWGTVIWERLRRHSGLDVTVVARKHGGDPNPSLRISTRLIASVSSRSRMAHRRSGPPVAWKSCSAMRAPTVWMRRPSGGRRCSPSGCLGYRAGRLGTPSVDRRTLAFTRASVGGTPAVHVEAPLVAHPHGASTLFGARASLRGCEARPLEGAAR